MKLKGAQIMMKVLQEEGVDTIFGYPGGAVIDIFDELDKGNQPDLQLYNRQLRELIVRAVEELPEHHRLIFTLRESEGKSYREIAEILDCGTGTVKSRLNRARTCFARTIEPYLGQWD